MGKFTAKLWHVTLFIMLILLAIRVNALASSQYTILPLANASELQSADPQKPMVSEFFSFACLHCYHLEKPLEAWVKAHKDKIEFQKIPVIWGRDAWRTLAKAYYISKALKMTDKLNLPMFQALHEKNINLSDKAVLAQFFAKQGVNKATFTAYDQSPTIDHQVDTAKNLVKTFKISQVPTLIINGEFQTGVAKAGSQKKLFAVLDALVKKAKQA